MSKKIGKRLKNDVIPLFIIAGIIFVMLGIVAVSGEPEKTVVSALMLLLMGGTLLFAQIKGVSKLGHMTTQLKQVTHWIQEQDKPGIWENMRKQENLFANKKLDQMFHSYVCEMDRLHREDETHVQCDIADYINEENILESCHGQLLDQLPGVLTGLGILGTFIGLTIGLNGFDNNGVEQMISSITPLIEGIKVAFYTSIFGVLLSLLATIYYKVTVGKVTEALEQFYDSFYKEVVHLPGNDLANQILHLQQSQTNAMEQFAEAISVQMAKSIESIAAPTFQKMGETMTALVTKMETTMDAFSDQTSRRQKEGMEQIVDTFLQQMNGMMGSSFENLKESVEALSAGQQETISRVHLLVDGLGDTIENIKQINKASKTTVVQLEQYSSKLHAFQTGVNEAYKQIEQQEALFAGITQQQIDCMTTFGAHEAAIVSSIEELNVRTKGMEAVFKAHTESMHTMSNEQSDTMKELNAIVKEHIESVHVMSNLQSDMMKERYESFQKQMEDMCEAFQKQMEEASTRQLQLNTQSLTEVSDALKTTFKEHAESAQEMAQLQSVTMKEIYDSFQRQMEEAARQQLKLNTQSLGEVSETLQVTTTKLEQVSNAFNENVRTSIQKTFKQFDTSLSDIALHLSGTISEINEVSQNIPRALQGSFVEMQKQLQGYLEAVAVMQKTAQETTNQMMLEATEIAAVTGHEK